MSVLLGVVLAALPGCSRSGDGPDVARPKAAEPAVAPPTTAAPAGRVVVLGPDAEGIVADPVTGIVAVGLRSPFRLALVDGDTGQVLREVPLPGHVRHLELEAPGGPVLVPAENSDLLLRVALPSGAVLGRTKVGRYPHAATAAPDGRILVGAEKGGSIAVVRANRVDRTLAGLTQPGGLAVADDRIGVVDVRQSTLTAYDATTLTRTGVLVAGAGATHMVAERRGRLVVVDTRGDALLVFAVSPRLVLVARTPLPGTPYGVAYDPDRDQLWVTLTARNEVVGLSLGDGTPREVHRYPTVVQPNTVAVDRASGRVYVASRRTGELELIDP